MMIFLEAY